MNNRPRMDDVYLSTLHNIDTTVRQLEQHHQELSKNVNQRLGALENKVDLLLSAFSDYKHVDQQRQALERSALVNGELSPDSGHLSTSNPSVDNSPNLANGHVYDEDLSNISSEYATVRSTASANLNAESREPPRADGMVTENYGGQRYDQMTQKKLTASATRQEEVQPDADDEVITSIQETVANPVRSKDERLRRRMNGNFGLMKSRSRSPSPLPSRSERIQVPYTKFRKLKTRPSEDNRTKYFEQDMDITHDDGYSQNTYTEASQPIKCQVSALQENNPQSQPGSELNTHQLPDSHQMSESQQNNHQPSASVDNQQLSESQLSNLQQSYSPSNKHQLSDSHSKSDSQPNNRELSESQLSNPPLSNSQSDDHLLSDSLPNNHQMSELQSSNRQISESQLQNSQQSDMQKNNRQVSETGLKNEHDDDNRFVRDGHLSNDDFLNRTRRKDWKKNLEKLKSRPEKNETVASKVEPVEASVSEKQDTQRENTERAQEVPTDTTTLVQQILSQQQRQAEESEDVRASDGLDTIICIDTSTSMAGDPLKKAQGILYTFLDGVENAAAEYELEENVAVVTFGRENKIVQHLTNDYDNVRDAIENLRTGGSSPLWLGLALSLTELSARGKVLKLEHRQLTPRIILVTDGFATSVDCADIADKLEPDKQVDQTIAALINMNLGTINAISPIIVTSSYNKESRTNLASMTSGSMVMNDRQIEQLHEYFRMQRTLDNMLTKFGNQKVTAKELQVQIKKKSHGLSDSSINNIVEILKSDTSIIKEEESVSQSVVEKETITKEINTVTTEEPGAEKLSFTLEPGWPRVRVSPDWSGNPDRYGLVGTVISTRKKGKVKVLWDNEIQETVKFGEGGVYEVHIVNEPKLLAKDETIAVGVFVERGPDWRWKNQDGGIGSIGVVTKIENGNVVHVVWPDGKLGNYRFGYSGKYDIQVCPDQKKPDHVIWEFRESSGGAWDMFPEDFMDEIESLYQTDPNMKSELTTNDTTYILDLESKKIIDGKSAELPWTIRRREMTDKEYRKYTDELAGLE